jgi:hypothetical protein
MNANQLIGLLLIAFLTDEFIGELTGLPRIFFPY